MFYSTSSDGTRIAFDRSGAGPALLIVGGSLADHHFYAPLAAEFAARDFTVYNIDRRGRGDSGDTPPYAVDREVEDVAAVVAEAGGHAHVYGHSAGSALALRAAAAGLDIDRLVMADPPFTPPDGDPEAARAEHTQQRQHIERLNGGGDYRGSVKFFLRDYGLPDDAMDDMLSSPAGASMIAAAQVLPYDYAMLGDGILPVDLAAGVTVPTLVIAGQDQPATAEALAAALPQGELRLTDASTHELSATEIAAVVTPFLTSH